MSSGQGSKTKIRCRKRRYTAQARGYRTQQCRDSVRSGFSARCMCDKAHRGASTCDRAHRVISHGEPFSQVLHVALARCPMRTGRPTSTLRFARTSIKQGGSKAGVLGPHPNVHEVNTPTLLSAQLRVLGPPDRADTHTDTWTLNKGARALGLLVACVAG